MTMRQKITLMMLLLSGVLFSCGRTVVDYESTIEHIYENQTEYAVTITGYAENTYWDGEVWSIDPLKSLNIKEKLPRGFTPNPSLCDSVLVTFDGKKNIMVRIGERFFADRKIENVDKRWDRYYYYITDELYNAAE